MDFQTAKDSLAASNLDSSKRLQDRSRLKAFSHRADANFLIRIVNVARSAPDSGVVPERHELRIALNVGDEVEDALG